MKFALRCAAGIGMLFAANLLHAQINTNDLAAIEATTPLSADAVPLFAVFYSAANPDNPPAPGNFYGLSAWDLGSGDYLLDDLGGTGGFHAMDEGSPVDGFTNEDGGYITNYFSYSPPTNGLWLQVSNVADGNMYVNLNGATDCVYAVLSSQSLGEGTTFSNWDIGTEVFGLSTNPVPFYVSMNGRNALFLSAMDWTGITSNGNETPDWWFYYWFGVDGLSLSDTNVDSWANFALRLYKQCCSDQPVHLAGDLAVRWSTCKRQQFHVTGAGEQSECDGDGYDCGFQWGYQQRPGLQEQSGVVWVQNDAAGSGYQYDNRDR